MQWCGMREGPPTKGREVRVKGSGVKFRVGRAISSSVARQGRPEYRLVRGHPVPGTHDRGEEG